MASFVALGITHCSKCFRPLEMNEFGVCKKCHKKSYNFDDSELKNKYDKACAKLRTALYDNWNESMTLNKLKSIIDLMFLAYNLKPKLELSVTKDYDSNEITITCRVKPTELSNVKYDIVCCIEKE